MNEIKNLDEMDNIKLISGSNFYCSGKIDAGITTGGFSIDTQNSANYIQIRIHYASDDSTSYYLKYELNGESKTFKFSPKNYIFSQSGSFSNFSCQLHVPANEGNDDTFCSISLLEI